MENVLKEKEGPPFFSASMLPDEPIRGKERFSTQKFTGSSRVVHYM
jgi:hypothetical protein